MCSQRLFLQGFYWAISAHALFLFLLVFFEKYTRLQHNILYDPQFTRKYPSGLENTEPLQSKGRSLQAACLPFVFHKPLTDAPSVRTIEDMRRSLLFWLPILWSLSATGVRAASPGFDLAGPKVDVHVKRGTVTLPISEASNLLPGDRLWIHPDLPDTQSEHFVLVVAFLRGTTNPPPPEWFTRVETWTREAHDEGVFVTVPPEAQQALLFLAPETGGDFNTLRKAVREEPGTFVRAAQDLQAASWERLRLDAYLDDVRITSQTNAAKLKARAELAARSLGIKINESCFDKPVDEQATCLSQNSEGMVLDDSNAQSLVNQLASGSALDIVNQLSVTTMAGGGMYSPYVGAIIDTAKLLSSLHTAHFQYIPALALPTTDTLNLRLNMPLSFRNPKSVVVVALPPIGPNRAEPLYAVDPEQVSCAPKPDLVLAAEGAPLAYATQFAHNLVLHIEPATDKGAPTSATGAGVDLPIKLDAGEGGLTFVGTVPKLPPGQLLGTVRGKWGFDDWQGPSFHLYSPISGKWAVAAGDQSALVVGRDDSLHIVGDNAQCVQQVEEQAATGSPISLPWTTPKPDTLLVKIPLQNAEPGPVDLDVFQYGLLQPDKIKMTAYDAAASLQNLTLSAGDDDAVLKGTRLDEVAQARLKGIVFAPAVLTRVEDLDQLILKAARSTAGLDPGKGYMAEVELKDGRRLKAPATVEPPRPQVMLLSKGVQSGSGAPSPVQFGSPDDLPVEGRLVFFLKSTTPARFPRNEKIELAAGDSSFNTTLDLSDGSLMLEDATTAEASLQPLSRFGFSAFGPVRVRAVAADGEAGDWVPLGTLVRLPGFNELRCPRSIAKPCLLTGSNLFLAASIANTQQFDGATEVPPEFTGTELIVPHPVNGQLYLKLRDDPETVQTLTLPVTYITPAEAKAALPATPSTDPADEPAPATEDKSAPAPTSVPQQPAPAKSGPITSQSAAPPNNPSAAPAAKPAASSSAGEPKPAASNSPAADPATSQAAAKTAQPPN